MLTWHVKNRRSPPWPQTPPVAPTCHSVPSTQAKKRLTATVTKSNFESTRRKQITKQISNRNNFTHLRCPQSGRHCGPTPPLPPPAPFNFQLFTSNHGLSNSQPARLEPTL